LKAVVIQGEIRPLEPLPDWQEGQRLRIEKADDETSVEEIDHDFAVLEKLCEASESAEEEQLERALQEARRLAKGASSSA
jgi:precorrin-6B methylase 1